MILLRVNDRDLSGFIRVAHGEGLDPADPGYVEPQFSGAPAFSEGQTGIGDAVGNREMVIPLILSADTTAALHTLIAEINGELTRGAQVEYATEFADDPTYFDLEAGRLDVDYQYWLARSNNIRATLHLWTRPFGHTGTSRPLMASVRATSVLQTSATGVLGDADALGKLEVRVGSRVASGGRVIAYGVHRSASFNGIRGPSSADFQPQSGATVIGASGAVGSQYLGVPVSPTTASGVAITSYLSPAAAHVGRHRILAVARSGLDRPIALYAKDQSGAVLGPTAVASVVDQTKWGLVDLGEVNVSDRRASQEAVPTSYVQVIAGGAPGNVAQGSYPLQVSKLVYLPLDESPGMLRTAGAGGDSQLYYDGFTRPILPGFDLLMNYPQTWAAEAGNVAWTRTAGNIAISAYGLAYAATGIGFFATPINSGSGFYSLASGRRNQDVTIEGRLILTASAAAASPVMFEIWPKQSNASIGFAAQLIPGPSQTLRIMSYSAAGASVMASAGIATTLASGIYQGQPHKLLVRANGGEIAAWLATAPAGSPALVASHAEIGAQGWPAVKISNSNSVAAGLPVIDAINVQSIGPGASDMGPREHFRFESYPERRAFQGNATAYLADRSAAFRGVHPRIPAGGSPGASGAAQLVVLAGDPTDFLGNDLMDVSLNVTERFAFLR